MSQASQKPDTLAFDLLAMGIIVLTSATALIHFLLALSIGPPKLTPFPLLFYLNALGYMILVIALYAPPLLRFRRLIRWTLIVYTAVTFALWFVLAPDRDPDGYLDKVLEAALIILLLVDDRRAARREAGLPPEAPRGC